MRASRVTPTFKINKTKFKNIINNKHNSRLIKTSAPHPTFSIANIELTYNFVIYILDPLKGNALSIGKRK